MIQPIVIAARGQVMTLGDIDLPLDLDRLCPTPRAAPWEVELGSGKGRFLLKRAAEHADRRFLAIEVASHYARLMRRRAERRGVTNLVTVRGEALYLMASILPRGFAQAVHVYFPDPWPKSRHSKRRLLDPETVDLMIALLAPGGALYCATDHLEYGERVTELLGQYPDLTVEDHSTPWPDGPRTNYEAKYEREGRSILRLEARLGDGCMAAGLHPEGAPQVLVGPHLARARRETGKQYDSQGQEL